jgi:hypothetical protein
MAIGAGDPISSGWQNIIESQQTTPEEGFTTPFCVQYLEVFGQCRETVSTKVRHTPH